MTDEPPAATVDLDVEDAHMALTTQHTRRHAHLDPYGELYKGVISTLAGIEQYERATDSADPIDGGENDVGIHEMTEKLVSLRDQIRNHVLEHREHAVRWTLDPYDEMDE